MTSLMIGQHRGQRAGDVVEIELERVGVLRNTVVQEGAA